MPRPTFSQTSRSNWRPTPQTLSASAPRSLSFWTNTGYPKRFSSRAFSGRSRQPRTAASVTTPSGFRTTLGAAMPMARVDCRTAGSESNRSPIKAIVRARFSSGSRVALTGRSVRRMKSPPRSARAPTRQVPFRSTPTTVPALWLYCSSVARRPPRDGAAPTVYQQVVLQQVTDDAAHRRRVQSPDTSGNLSARNRPALLDQAQDRRSIDANNQTRRCQQRQWTYHRRLVPAS